MSANLYDLVVNITANTASLQTSLNQAAGSVKSAGSAIENALGVMKAGFVGLASAVSVDTFLRFGESVVHAASNLNSLAQSTGSSVESLSRLSNQAQIAGTDFATFQAAMFQLNKRMAESKDSSSDAARALQFLGVSAKDPAQAFEQVVQAMSRYEGGIGKAALATALFGKSGQDFLATLDNMARLGDVNATVTAKQADEAEKLELALHRLSVESTTFKNIVLSDIVPALNTWIQQFITLREAGGSLFAFLNANTSTKGLVGEIENLDAKILKLQADIAESTKRRDKNSPFVFFDPAALRDAEAQLAAAQKLREGFAKLRDQANPLDTAGDRTSGTSGDAGFRREQSGDAANFLKTAMEQARKAVVDANVALNDVGLTAAERTTPAMKALLAIEDNPAFKALPIAMRQQVEALFAQADATQRLAQFQQSNLDAENKHWDMLKKQKEAEVALESAIDARAQSEYQAALNRSGETAANALTAITDAVHAEELRAASIGKTRAELVEMTLAQERANLAVVAEAVEVDPAAVKAIELRIAALERLKGAVGNTDNLQTAFDGLRQVFTDLASAGSNFIVDFVEHGTRAFSNLWDNFKHWALRAIADIASKQIVVSIAASLGAGGAAAQTFGLGSSTGGAGIGGIGSLGNIASLFTAGGTLGTQFGAFGANLGLASSAGLDAVGGLSGLLSSGAGAFMAAVPWVALAAVAVPLIVGLFDKGPAERSASFGSNAGLGAGNPLFRSSSAFGSLGVFNDKWFSNADQGKSITDFLAGLTGIDNALAHMVGADTVAKIQERLANVTTTFEAGVEHQATEFGSIMKDRYVAVLDAIDPELGTLATAFAGTGEQLGKFVVDVVGVFETLKSVDTSKLFGQGVSVSDIANLTPTGESVADTFKNLVEVFTVTDQIAQAFGRDINEAFGAIGLASAGAREELVGFLGGVNQAGAAVSNYLQTAFTDEQRNALLAAQGTATLTEVFAGLGRAVPQTWEELNTLIDSFGTTTTEGRQLTATFLTQVVPAFTAVHGTAQDAAAAIDQAAEALARAHDSATQFFDRNFLSADEQRAQNLANVATESARLTDELAALGQGAIPTTISGFHDFIIALRGTGDAGSDLADTIVNDVGQSIVDLNANAGKAADAVDSLATSIGSLASQAQPHTDLVQSQLDVIGSGAGGGKFGSLTAQAHFLAGSIAEIQGILANALPGSDSARLAQQQLNQLTPINNRITQDLALFVSLRAQYGNTLADQLFDLQKQHDANVDLFSGSTQALADFEASFHQQWNDIINGTSSDMQKLIDRIHDYLRQLTTSDVSPLSPLEKFHAAQDQFRADLALAQQGNAEALGRITQDSDTYLKLSRDVFASGAEGVAAFNEVVNSLTGLDTAGPTNVNATIAAAMPQGSTVASAADTVALGDSITGELQDLKATVAALLVRLSADSQDVVDAVGVATRAINNQPALTARA